MHLTSIEICAGAGGQALGLEQAGFEHLALVEIENAACRTLKANRPAWNVLEGDVKHFNAVEFQGRVDLFAGGVPCPPFSIAGKQLGEQDERDLFPEALRLVEECNPRAVMLENVKGILDAKFLPYRREIVLRLHAMGYDCDWRLMNASDFGVSQLRPRAILVAMKREYFKFFRWPAKQVTPPTVGELLGPEMASMGWENAPNWIQQANHIAPTLVGGSKKHGGADLGPSRARLAWAKLGVNGIGIADAPPTNGFSAMPKLTLRMAALVQGFPATWNFEGKKTPAYRQIGNAFPPPVAKAIGQSIIAAFVAHEQGKGKEARLESQTA